MEIRTGSISGLDQIAQLFDKARHTTSVALWRSGDAADCKSPIEFAQSPDVTCGFPFDELPNKLIKSAFFAVFCLTLFGVSAHAQSRWVDAPAQYVGKYKGPIETIVVKPHEIQGVCEKLAGKNIFRRFFAKKIRIAGCSQMADDGQSCIIVIPDKPIKGISVERIETHEKAHCGLNGWPAHHPR